MVWNSFRPIFGPPSFCSIFCMSCSLIIPTMSSFYLVLGRPTLLLAQFLDLHTFTFFGPSPVLIRWVGLELHQPNHLEQLNQKWRLHSWLPTPECRRLHTKKKQWMQKYTTTMLHSLWILSWIISNDTDCEFNVS